MEETTLEEELKEILSSALPTVQQLVIGKLLNSGVESKDNLKYVRQEDNENVLPVIQQRKLLDAFKIGMLVYFHKISISQHNIQMLWFIKSYKA